MCLLYNAFIFYIVYIIDMKVEYNKFGYFVINGKKKVVFRKVLKDKKKIIKKYKKNYVKNSGKYIPLIEYKKIIFKKYKTKNKKNGGNNELKDSSNFYTSNVIEKPSDIISEFTLL